MSELPNPYDKLTGADRTTWKHMAGARSHSEGRATLGEVYVRMFNNPAVAEKVGALGEHLRFGGVLPDAIRETVILRYSYRQKFGYEWAHHQRPARLAGLTESEITALADESLPADESPPADVSATSRAVIEAVDAVVAGSSIPPEIQSVIVDAFGYAGVVEVVALCGLYAIMGYTVTAFDIPIEEGLPTPPFESRPQPGN